MADEIKRKAMPQKSGGEVATRVAEGQADIGLTLIAEIVPIPGVRVVGKIPAPLGNDTTYAAGISADCADQAAAAAFIAALAQPAERGGLDRRRIRVAGMTASGSNARLAVTFCHG